MLNIIARKPKYLNANNAHDASIEFVVVERHNGEFVSATASPQSLAYGEWFWGHYFNTRADAIAHFNSREVV